MVVVVRWMGLRGAGCLALLLGAFAVAGSANAYTIGAVSGTNTARELELRLTLWDDGNPLQAVFHETGCSPDADCPFSLTIGVEPVFFGGPGGGFGTFQFSAALRHEGSAEFVQFSGHGHELGTHPLDAPGPFWQHASFHLAEGEGESYLTVSASVPEPGPGALFGASAFALLAGLPRRRTPGLEKQGLLRAEKRDVPRRRRGFRGAPQPMMPGTPVAVLVFAVAVGLPGAACAFTVDVLSVTNEPGLFSAAVQVLYDGNTDPIEARVSGCVPDVPSAACPFTLNLQVWPVPILPGVFEFYVSGNLEHIDSPFAPAFELYNHDPQLGTEIVLGQDEVWQTWSLTYDGATRFDLVATAAAVPEPKLATLAAGMAVALSVRRHKRRKPRPV